MAHNRIPVRRQSERQAVLARLLQRRAEESYQTNLLFSELVEQFGDWRPATEADLEAALADAREPRRIVAAGVIHAGELVQFDASTEVHL